MLFMSAEDVKLYIAYTFDGANQTTVVAGLPLLITQLFIIYFFKWVAFIYNLYKKQLPSPYVIPLNYVIFKV